tara:strand:+ start:854 stop:997 length:144 start_codon:yes stop_codon:yes gene_type:complete
MYELNFPYRDGYGDLSNKDNFRSLAQSIYDNGYDNYNSILRGSSGSC